MANAAYAPVKEKVLAFVLSSGDYGSPATGGQFPDDAALYTLRECRSRDVSFFSEAENAAIEGHIAVSRSRFNEALIFFRAILNSGAEGNSGSAAPELFLQYPVLLNDLGRCFQYAASDSEGMELFLKWENNLAGEQNAAASGPDINDIRFRLLFFAARIARQRGRIDQGMELFTRALPLAPDSTQADACIWYILDSALSRGTTIRQLETFIPQWHKAAYFSDVLDKLSRDLVAKRRWKELLNVFALIQNRADPASIAKYAWITGRAIEAGYLSPAETAADPAGSESPARAYQRIAYNTGTASFYYRSLSAAALNEPFLNLPPPAEAQTAKASGGKPSMAAEFLLGFFGNNAAEFAPRYIRALEKELSTGELRTLAEALDKAGLHAESIRLVSVYAERADFQFERQDLELLYPRPFRELVEQYAEETGIAPALLYGLIRTESAFQSGIISRAGAVGLTQLMPATAAEMAGRIRRRGGPDYSDEPDLRDPGVNIHIGAVYLAYLVDRMESVPLALLAYNGGMNRVRRWRTADNRRGADNQRGADSRAGALPADLFLETVEYPETREYGRKVLAAAAVYEALY
jgi:soluble lytic murein transglycosylase